MGAVTRESSPSPRISKPTVDPALSEAWEKFGAAFNRKDAREVAAFWEPDGTLMGPTGNRGIGRPGVEKVFAEDVNQFLRGTTSTFTFQTFRKLGRDLVWFDMDHVIQGARLPDGSSGTMKLHIVVIARRQGQEWRWLDTRPYAFLPAPPSASLH